MVFPPRPHFCTTASYLLLVTRIQHHGFFHPAELVPVIKVSEEFWCNCLARFYFQRKQFPRIVNYQVNFMACLIPPVKKVNGKSLIGALFHELRNNHTFKYG